MPIINYHCVYYIYIDIAPPYPSDTRPYQYAIKSALSGNEIYSDSDLIARYSS